MHCERILFDGTQLNVSSILHYGLATSACFRADAQCYPNELLPPLFKNLFFIVFAKQI